MANTKEVDDYLRMTRDLIGEAHAYAGAREIDPDKEGMLRELQVATASLQTALQQAAFAVQQRPRTPPGG